MVVSDQRMANMVGAEGFFGRLKGLYSDMIPTVLRGTPGSVSPQTVGRPRTASDHQKEAL